MEADGTSSTEITEIDGVVRVFRERKYYRNLGIIGLIFYTSISIGAAYAMWDKVLALNNFFDIAFACFMFSFFPGINLWILLAYKYESLTIQNESVIQQGVIFRKEIDLSSVKQARWNLVQGGGITLKSLTEKISIYFENFEREERLWLIQYFQSHLPESIQQNWDLFCLKIAIPLRDPQPKVFRDPGPDEILITRKRYDRFGIPLSILSIICTALAAWYFRFPRYLGVSVIPIGFWLLLRYSIPKRGMVGRRISADRDLKQMLIFLFCWGALGLIGIIILKIIDFPEPQNMISNVCLMCIWFTILLIIVSKLDRNRHKLNLKKAKEAVIKWNPEVDSQTED
ncbi:hypothetical protein [uncultured Gimesia sp.]|uniref:hypothetical protein n=1 Tax=uncultured Gimesia sp. TaxID=1678688 RepID=UPI00262C183C|nr:hypothetical protein [uncultured Gimesia sp.]